MDSLFFAPGCPIPHNLAKTFDGPSTLLRSGFEHRVGRFPSSTPGGGKTEMIGGAFLKGKEGRVGSRNQISSFISTMPLV